MDRIKIRKFISKAVLGVVLLTSVDSHAYIPPSFYILKTWSSKRSKVKNIRIRSIISSSETKSDLKSESVPDIHFKETTFYDAATETIQSVATDDQGKNLYATTKKSDAQSPLAKLLFSSNAEAVAGDLKIQEIPIRTEKELLALDTEEKRLQSEKQSFVRWNQHVAWVMGGSGSKQDFSPQLWFEKDSFFPLRFIYSNQSLGETVDVQLENYQALSGVPLPRLIRVLKKDGSVFIVSQVTDVMVNFKHESNHTNGLNGFSSTGVSASGALKNLIQQYYDVVR